MHHLCNIKDYVWWPAYCLECSTWIFSPGLRTFFWPTCVAACHDFTHFVLSFSYPFFTSVELPRSYFASYYRLTSATDAIAIVCYFYLLLPYQRGNISRTLKMRKGNLVLVEETPWVFCSWMFPVLGCIFDLNHVLLKRRGRNIHANSK
jgi:hypothetical protein